ncbi:hypothetical protein [Rathayibacter iranicus]|uniref:Uncharacterized protein n=1 Tax=Rathayibacter iranicus TaxID=59737 RepID=A0AAD1EM88_9MICO|nr:hypothetical protein [Rathayibacter iranicus]AZZ55828.1 hypothetical protein C7V51_08040 [Rathayibacter iranicus]MWV30737.1 hypothetical protein [Rathayibacter iranicus NCPPB 2253 = VKM Ac-1602]PPI47597.1 hypothetical protein C5E09_07080 [Rathayibacter iranicus]PPI60442.1 hypothetical protein C5E08_08010 [Rathayibacter iranicus]PPI71931.1 hypothetical protein C5E01_07050 [Rathayibacter iranicus]
MTAGYKGDARVRRTALQGRGAQSTGSTHEGAPLLLLVVPFAQVSVRVTPWSATSDASPRQASERLAALASLPHTTLVVGGYGPS